MTELTTGPVIAGVGRPVSRLALGTAFFSSDGQERWFELLDAFVAAGGNLIDSARGYGESEEVVGRWLASRGTRERVILITKGAHGEGVIPEAGYGSLVSAELGASLEALQTDVVDLYLLHRDNQEMPVADILGPLYDEIANGRVRAIGLSNWEYRRLSEVSCYAAKHGLPGLAAVSNNISLALPAGAFYPGLVSTDSQGEKWHRETGVPLIPWSSQARGFYSGEYTRQMRGDPVLASPPEKTFTSRMLKLYCTDENFERLDRARELGRRKGGFSAAEIALAWLLRKPFPLVPIVGPRTPEELASCIRATSLGLTDDEARWLDLEV